MARKNYSFEEIRDRFEAANPGGSIFKHPIKKGVYCVHFFPNGKVYDYRAGSPYSLGKALKMLTDEELLERKGMIRNSCGCPVPVKYQYRNGYRCSNCGAVLREPTAAQLKEEEEERALWSSTKR